MKNQFVHYVEVWRASDGYVVALRGVDTKSLRDDTGKPEESTHPRKVIAVREANRLARHYGVAVVLDITMQERKR